MLITIYILLLQQHELLCQYKPITCPFCNDDVSNLEEHVQTCTMIKQQEHCPFKEAGCTYKVLFLFLVLIGFLCNLFDKKQIQKMLPAQK